MGGLFGATAGTTLGRRVALTDLVIPLAGTDSNALSATELNGVSELVIYAPAALDAGTYTVEVRASDTGNWCTLQSSGADVEIAADKAIVLLRAGYSGLRIHCTVVAGAARTFNATASVGA